MIQTRTVSPWYVWCYLLVSELVRITTIQTLLFPLLYRWIKTFSLSVNALRSTARVGRLPWFGNHTLKVHQFQTTEACLKEVALCNHHCKEFAPGGAWVLVSTNWSIFMRFFEPPPSCAHTSHRILLPMGAYWSPSSRVPTSCCKAANALSNEVESPFHGAGLRLSVDCEAVTWQWPVISSLYAWVF